MNSLLDIHRTISCRKSARYLMHPTHVNCIILYIYTYIYKLYILYQVILRAGNKFKS